MQNVDEIFLYNEILLFDNKMRFNIRIRIFHDHECFLSNRKKDFKTGHVFPSPGKHFKIIIINSEHKTNRSQNKVKSLIKYP